MLSAVRSFCVPKSRFASLLRSLFGCAAVVLLPLGAKGQASFSGVVVITSNTAVPSGSYTLTSLTVQNGALLTIGGGSTVTVSGGVVVTGNSSIVLQSSNNTAQVNGVWAGQGVTVNAGSVEVDAGSAINADGQGYLPGAGPGGAAAGDSGGGSYGGMGGPGYNGTPAAATYGSTTAPIDLGSGGNVRCCGGVAGAGGGALTLTVSGTLTNNGIISANGASATGNVTAGAGSGGSVYVTTGGLTGAGIFTANGGGNGVSEGGGGGGRIAVYYNGTASNFTGFATSTTTGGMSNNGNNAQGATGTSAFLDTSAANSNLMVYQDLTIPAGSTVSYNSITVQSGAVLTIGGGSTVNIAQTLTVSGTAVLQSINNSAQVNNVWAGAGVTLNAASITVNMGGSINADGQGYVAGAGPGGAVSGDSGGGSYGGVGGPGYNGAPAPATYGSTTAPIDLGSGGSVRCCGGIAGAGGGAMRLVVSGTLTNNGNITSNGTAATGNVTAGGGSGGSIYVTTGGLTGAGLFAANGGGGGVSEGGGGGGRIAIYYNATSGNFTGFATSTATGGTSNNGNNAPGANGTTGFFDTSATNNNLSVYQNFVIPASTTVNYNSLTVQAGALLTVGGGATVNVAQALTVNGTLVAQAINNAAQVNGAWTGVGVGIQAASVTVGANGSINADAQGYLAGAGPGAAVAGDSGGGSYGGVGGAGYDGTPAAATYGSTTVPTDLGSGGNVRCCSGVAGAGGGAITLTVSGTLTDNGIISANGASATVNVTAGGGSGGTVSIRTGTLAGTGAIAVNGGGGGVSEGGGGGGRIAVYYNTNTGFNLDSATANGGISNHAPQLSGAAGTVYTLAMGSALTVTDNTALPANANLTYTSITINNGASLTLGSGTTLTANSINVSAASTFTVGGGSTLNVSGAVVVTGNSNVIFQSINNTAQVKNVWAGAGAILNAGSVQVDAGSSINADGQGYLPGAGPGAAAANDSGGGSYGGKGGAGYNGTPATATYGSTTAPTDLGSGGNVRCCGGIAGAGGGALTLTVSGTLTNNGVISANGAVATGNVTAGGGSGGSVYVTTGGLSGAGIFTANGGGGGVSEGGGGGGRIAIYYNGTSSNFTGFATSTASGGTSNNGNNAPGATGTSAFFDTSATNNNLSVYQNFVIPANTTVTYNSITSQTGALITIGGGANVTVTSALTVSGTVVAQAINNTAQVNGAWAGSGVTLNAGSITVNTNGSLNADGQGYVAGAGPGAAASGDSGGGSYGGMGGAGFGNGTPAAATYGFTIAPTDLGSGGSVRCCGGIAGAGGGAMRLIVSGTLTNNGTISANGAAATGNVTAGGGSGGAIYATTGGFAGTGVFAANGGGGGVSEGGGGGGRIAIYYNSNTGFNPTSVAAAGGTSNHAPQLSGAPGTVYLLGAGSNLTVAANTALPANANLTYTSITVNNAGTLSFGSNSAVTAGSISLSAAGTMTVGGGSTVTASGALTVTGNSNIVLQSTNNTGQVNGVWAGAGVTLVAATAQIDPGSSINADGQGYVAGSGPGAAAAGDSGGGSYGGKGGAGYGNGTPAAATYGSATAPVSLGSGGNVRCCGGIPGAGGGAMRFIVSGTLTDNGIISANGAVATGNVTAGGGSGGSVFLITGALAGTGTIAANGGGGGVSEGGGGGGRIAVYYLTSGGFNLASATANGGTSNNNNDLPGANGTVTTVNGPTTVFLQPTESVIHGTATIQYFTNIGGSSTLTLAGPQTATLATNAGDISTVTFDTTQVPDGSYQLLLSVMNSSGQQVQQITQSEVINNSVQWHTGTLSANQTWGPTPVQALDGNVIVPAGVTLTIAPGTVVKALPGAQIVVQSGGTLIATGTTGLPVIFTTFDDYTVGGDTDFNQGTTVPDPGEWNGIAVTGGTFASNSNTIIRYALATLSGTLGANTTLFATQVYTITGTLTVPSGVTLSIQPGSILKFGPGAGMDVQPGATLTANGTLAQPIYFTSINDISIGGDTNGTNGSVMPAAGDWNSIILDGATVSLQHVQMQYGGGPLNAGAQAGMVETTDNANVTISNSVLANSYFIGIQTGYPNGGGDTVTVTDTTFYSIEDRAINAFPGSTVHVVNDTIDGNAAGVFAHGGTVDVENSIISNSLGTQFGGIQACCGGVFSLLLNNDVYTTSTTGAGNYVGVNDPTGTMGNISASPVYMNQALHDYRPTYGSPAIDAANGTVANYPLTDAFGQARYNDPLVTTKTGTADINGNYPDMGAFEFVQTAPSNLDLTVSNVQGPTTANVGSQVTVTWTVTNIGSGTVYGPWHDAVYLVTDPNTNPVSTLAGTVLEGTGAVLGPGGSYSATATVTVPGVTVGAHRWEVKTNVLGEIFEGANTANNTGIALNEVTTDLTQLVPGAAPINGSFAGAGQSSYYKVIPSATQATSVQLALNSGLGGSVQLFVGAGYVPSPQRFDYQQVEYNSTSASVVIPSGSTQTYYVTAYSQTLPAAPAAFTIQASNVSFSLTSVTPSSAVASGSATFTFTGGGFTSGTTFILKAQTGGTYGGNPTFLADSDHADVTFNVGGIPPGSYTAEAINGSTVSLANAVTLTAPSLTALPLNSNVQVTLETPEAFRAGFPSVVTLHYTNVSNDDIAAPLIYVSAANATLSEVAPSCSTCSANYTQQYAGTFNSGFVMGIHQQGPAGVLPAGASGSIQFLATPTSLNSVNFYASPDLVDPLATQLTLAADLCYQTTGIVQDVCYFNNSPVGAYQTAASFCSSITPAGTNTEGQQRACMLLLNNAGYTYQSLQLQPGGYGDGLGLESYWNQYNFGHVTAANFNALLAADATALSASGSYVYDMPSLLNFELQKDGLDQFATRYHQGAFGFGPSHPFDITLNNKAVTYPDGTVRSFMAPSPTQANTFLGSVGDYGTLTLQTDGSYLLTEPDGQLFHFAVNGSGFQFDYVQDRDGNRVNITYTGALVTGATDAFGDSIAFQYDSLGHIIQATDQAGRVTTFTYDILGDKQRSTFLTGVTDATGTTTIKWNEGGTSGVGYFDDSCVTTYCGSAISVASITSPDGTQSNYTYDAAGRLVGQTGANGVDPLTYTYNINGSLTVTDAYGKTVTYAANASGYPLVTTDPLGNVTRFRYDGEDKIIASLGALGDSYSATFDTQGNPASVFSALGNQTNFVWAAEQSPTSLTDSNGNATSFTFDANTDLLSKNWPNGTPYTYTYNAQGQPISRTNRRGHTETMVWGPHGTLTSKTLANGTTISYTYDSHDNILSSTTPAGTTRYTWDGADRVTSLTNPDGTGVTMTYNAGGQRTSMKDSTGFVTNYAYDSAGRVSKLTDGNGNTIVTYTFDLNGRMIGKTLGNGTSASFSYDPLGRPLSVINYSPSKAVLSEYDYTYDAEGNPLTMKAPNGNYTYAYDIDSQLTSATTPNGTVQYTFDAAGNRTQVTTNGAVATYEPNNLNEYQVANNVAYQYDADGNLISGNGWTYTYDDENHMLSMSNGSNTWTFQYDGLGNRVLATHNGVTTRYLIDPAGYGNLVAELNSSGQANAHYVYGLDLTSTVQASGTSYYNYDGTGNTVQLTSSTGAVVNSYSYLPFGEQTVQSASVTNPFTFAGELGARDEGTGLYFMRNRWYNPALGRFQQPDPVGIAGGENLYTYALNNPLTSLDPLGLKDDYTAFSIGMIAQVGVTVNNHNGDTFISVGVATGGGVSVVQGDVSLKNPTDRGQAVSDMIGGVSVNVGGYAGAGGGINITPSGDISADHGFGLGGKGGSLNYSIPVPNNLGEVHSMYDQLNVITGGLLYDNITNTLINHQVNSTYLSNPLTDPGHPIFPHQPPPVCGGCLTTPTHIIIDPVNVSKDPNGKLTSGYGNSGYVPAGAPLIYTVYFENQPTATLPAQKVTVTDPLAANLDWSTVQFNTIAFNNVTLTPPATSQNYTTQATVSTDSNPVSVAAAVNPSTGVVTWTMQSVDPVTGSAPANPLAGFLPPNNSANAGSGYVTFSVMPKAGLANGTTIANQASIVFDVNAPIATNTVTNALDTSTVTSAVSPMPASTNVTALTVSWTGSDPTGSGIAYYNIYVSIDGGAYALWLSATTLTSSTYTALAGHSYAFYSMATNNVGIVQSTPAAAQTVNVTYITPTVTVTPAASVLTSAQSLSVVVTVANPVSGGSVPTGTVVLSSGSYTSAAATLVGGAASITVPAGALASGPDTLTATYTPDSTGTGIFVGATGSAQVTVGTPAVPTGTLTPPALNFTATSGSTSAAQTVQFTNTGSVAIGISGVTLTGTGAASFAETSSCGTSLPAGYSCNISVIFTPSSVSSFSATLSVADNATGSPQTVSLSGTGTAVPAPIASLTPVSLTFTATSGSTSAVQTAQLTNSGSAPLTIAGIGITGAGAGSFTQTNTCGASLAAGGNCLISLTFAPTSVATFAANLSVSDNAAGSPQSIALTGTGTAAPAPVLSITPSTLTFTSTIGIASTVQTAQLNNTGNAPLSFTSFGLTGTGAASFAQTNTCGTSLAAGANCSVSITFTPSSVGSFSAGISIADNAAGSPQSITLNGTSVAAPTFQLSATPSSQSVLAGSTAAYTISVNPQGGAYTSAVVLTASGLPAGATATFTPVSVTPGTSAVTSTLNIVTPMSFARLRPFDGSSMRPILALLGISLLAIRKRRRAMLLNLLLLVSFAGLASLTGCGSAPQSISRSYTITVTGTSGSQSQTVNLTLTLHN